MYADVVFQTIAKPCEVHSIICAYVCVGGTIDIIKETRDITLSQFFGLFEDNFANLRGISAEVKVWRGANVNTVFFKNDNYDVSLKFRV